VIHLPCRPGVVGVAGGAVGPERRPVRGAVAVGARRELQAGEGALDVAARAVDLAVRPGEGKAGAGVVEGAAGRGELHRRRVTRGAGGPQRPLVGVGVARGARGAQRQERPGLVAAGALARQRGVEAVEGELSLLSVIEVRRVEGAQLGVKAGVLGVAPDTLVGDVAVHTLACRDPIGDRFVAREALRGGHLAARLVTLLAVGDPLERRVRARQRPRRHERADLRLRRGRDQQDEEQPQRTPRTPRKTRVTRVHVEAPAVFGRSATQWPTRGEGAGTASASKHEERRLVCGSRTRTLARPRPRPPKTADPSVIGLCVLCDLRGRSVVDRRGSVTRRRGLRGRVGSGVSGERSSVRGQHVCLTTGGTRNRGTRPATHERRRSGT
jgi:hypothetical protein